MQGSFLAGVACDKDVFDVKPGRERAAGSGLLDEGALLACMSYVDLNPIRAGIAETPEDSDFTSIQERLREWQTQGTATPSRSDEPEEPEEPSTGTDSSTPSEHETPVEPAALMPFFPEPPGGSLLDKTEPTDRCFIPITFKDYAELLDWTGRALRTDKRGAIPEHLLPIFNRLQLQERNWLDTVTRWRESICQRQRYHCSFSAASARSFTGRSVSNSHSTGSSPSGGFSSRARIAVTSIGASVRSGRQGARSITEVARRTGGGPVWVTCRLLRPSRRGVSNSTIPSTGVCSTVSSNCLPSTQLRSCSARTKKLALRSRAKITLTTTLMYGMMMKWQTEACLKMPFESSSRPCSHS